MNILICFHCDVLQKSKDHRKGPVIVLHITYRGVKFVDAATKVTIITDVLFYKYVC